MPIELTREHLTYLNIGRRYWTAELSQASEQQKEALRGYVIRFKKAIRAGVGLYLFGSNGSGKTFLSSALLKEAWRRWGIAGYCVTAAELKAAFARPTEAHAGSEELMVERAEASRLFVIDDLGKEYRATSGFAEVSFGALLRHRSREELATIITTNMGPKEFAEVYGASTAKLLKECMLPVKLGGRDHRDDAADELRRLIKE